ncbi:MAG TPA: hypothetical protein VNV44_09645 [Solirubrobacteraceae bacterium]|nr:hypothetical protein [Solirubrobacteraceae bacterium]
MGTRRVVAALTACALAGLTLGAGSAQAAKKAPKPKDYTYCVTNGPESECFENEPFEVFRKTHTWKFGSEAAGTYTTSGKSVVFHETTGPDELVGNKVGHGVIAGTLRENGKNTEWTFTLTPQ